MIDFFYKWYSLTHGCVFFKKTKIDVLNRHVVILLANLILPVYFKLSHRKKAISCYFYKNRHRKVVASVTTYPARIGKVWLSIESILRQTVVPDIVVLWLSKEQFSSIEELPANLLALRKQGLIIELREGDLRSHKKYYYALKEYADYDLFTFDDDIIYPSDSCEKVLEAALLNTESCICRYSNQIRLESDNQIYWSRTQKDQVNKLSYFTFCGSGGGTLYPVGTLPDITLNKDVFMKKCRTADDVWLNSMLRFNKKLVVAIMSYCPLLSILNKDRSTLSDINIGDENRRQFNAVREYCIANGFDIYDLLR